jgi:hypothetical protein
MSYVDMAIAISVFILFLGIILGYAITYFTSLPEAQRIAELRDKAIKFFDSVFRTKGTPENWEKINVTPSELGLALDLYRIPVLIEEANSTARSNEPVTVFITFDESCVKKAWNNTVRIYDENFNEVPLKLSNETFCGTSQFLNQSNVTWKVSLAANQTKKFYIYFSPDENVSSPSYGDIPLDGANITKKIFPEEKITAISSTKWNVLKNMSYEELRKTIGEDYRFRIEISE